LRREEQEQMQRYVDLRDGHMKFLVEALDGDSTSVAPAPLPPLSSQVTIEMVKQAASFLRRTTLPFEPRKKWPSGGLPRLGVTAAPAAGRRAQEGRGLCAWGDAGWGRQVHDGKCVDGRFDEELVDACVALLERWNPEPAPAWVTSVPSLRRPELVHDFAGRL